jgi:predicted ATP-dependent endonuclease of OLD family
MLTSLSITADFKAIPYLCDTKLMQKHKGSVQFSLDKPNVIIGPNGSGKTALLDTITLRFLCYFENHSRYKDSYVRFSKADEWWTDTGGWLKDQVWLGGLNIESDNAPAAYFRPNHIPGNETNIATALMVYDSEAAKAYGEKTKHKSTGEKSIATLQDIYAILDGTKKLAVPAIPNSTRVVSYPTEYDKRVRHLHDNIHFNADGRPLVIMDEPERSLDGLQELKLWKAILAAKKPQVIVATHSLFPVLHSDRFNIIETQRGYINKLKRMLLDKI